jgi:hypothetical protein
MRIRLAISYACLVGLLCKAQGPPTRSDPSAQPQRAERLKELGDYLQIRTPEDVARVTEEYSNGPLKEFRRIVQEQVLETLNQSDKPEDIRRAVLSLGVTSFVQGNKGWPPAYSFDLQGVKTFVVAYEWAYGPLGTPRIKVMIDGFRKVGLIYELAAETGDGLEGCDIRLLPLDSPRPNETWFLATGQIMGSSRYLEPMRIFSFDGYQFKDLWAPSALRRDPGIDVKGDTVTVTYYQENDSEHALQDTITLTSGGPIVSTLAVQQ